MTNELDPKTPVLKGVVTEVLDNGNAGKINCGHGNISLLLFDCFIAPKPSTIPVAAVPALIFA